MPCTEIRQSAELPVNSVLPIEAFLCLCYKTFRLRGVYESWHSPGI